MHECWASVDSVSGLDPRDAGGRGTRGEGRATVLRFSFSRPKSRCFCFSLPTSLRHPRFNAFVECLLALSLGTEGKGTRGTFLP